jgi:hypothetical protein
MAYGSLGCSQLFCRSHLRKVEVFYQLPSYDRSEGGQNGAYNNFAGRSQLGSHGYNAVIAYKESAKKNREKRRDYRV